MTNVTPDHSNTSGSQDLPPRVASFLASYEMGPGVVTAEQGALHPDLAPTILRMQVLDTPFTFGTIDSFLPDELYQAILREWPESSAFNPVAKFVDGRPDAYFGTRKERILENWAAGDQLDSDTWGTVRLALRHPDFVRALFTRFAETIETNLAALDLDVLRTSSFKLYANVDAGVSEALGAHVDALPKLLTIVVYLDLTGPVSDSSPDRWGTALYAMKPGEIQPLSFTANADHIVAHQIRFRPNRAFVMPNDSQALHGVPGGEDGVQRRTLMCGYWLSKQTSRD
ncbi:hypothetical protein OG613_48190 (plasmid) [Streptomyces sp. NBC_00015]|uniref:hypothetical protein n=1 Tax=Streptomyces sp. NBC_00015 TaxID=2903611 RepID=UPI002F919CDB